MGQSAEEVRREIERTRAQMGYTIDEIGDRVSPRRMVERRTDRVKSTFRGVRESVMGSADYGMQMAGHAAGTGASTIGSGVSSGVGAVGAGVSSVGSTVSGAATTAVDTLSQAPQMARRQTAGNPLAAGLIAFGGGVLLASLLPKTQAEQQLATKVAPTLEPVKEQAREAGQQVAEQVKSAASDATEQIKEHASEAADQVKQQTAQAAQTVTEQANAAKGEVTSTASDATSTVTDEATRAAQQVKDTTTS